MIPEQSSGDGLRIDHITYSSSGGAGQVARNLQMTQCELGADSRLITGTDRDLRSTWGNQPGILARASTDYFLVRRRRDAPLFSLFRRGNLARNHSLRLGPKSVHHLHWMPGMMDVELLRERAASVDVMVWTLHDMWPFTGGCHHSMSCSQFQTGCHSCPQVRPAFRQPVAKSMKRRQQTFSGLRNLHFVAPSHWMRSRAESSHLLQSAPLAVIPNPVHDAFFNKFDTEKTRRQFSVDPTDFVVSIVAANLKDSIKGVDRALRLLNHFAIMNPATRIVVILIGSGAPLNKFVSIRTIHTGYVGDATKIAEIVCSSDVFVSLSIIETAPLAVAEALSLGKPIICTSAGGLLEYTHSGRTGIAVESDSDFLQAVKALYLNSSERLAMGRRASEVAAKTFKRGIVAQRYLDLYRDALANSGA